MHNHVLSLHFVHKNLRWSHHCSHIVVSSINFPEHGVWIKFFLFFLLKLLHEFGVVVVSSFASARLRNLHQFLNVIIFEQDPNLKLES